jgi:SPP1 family predicted phage head-tail adaptor
MPQSHITQHIRRTIDVQRHLISLDQVSQVPDGDGGYVNTWTPLTPPQLWAAIEPASLRGIEAVTASTTIQAVATHVVTMDYHPQVTVQSRIHFRSREFQIHAVTNVDEANQQHILVCSEVLNASGGGRTRGVPSVPGGAAD